MKTNIVLAGHGSGKPSTKGMNSYCTSRFVQDRGLVEVRRFSDITDKQRKKMHDLYATIIGRNIYSQSLRSFCYEPYGGNYYSDCSSSICRTAEKAGILNVASLNTAGMHYHMDKVEEIVIENGIIVNPELLKVGDALMFKGADVKRPLQIGHTEMVFEIKTLYGDEVHKDQETVISEISSSENMKTGIDCIKLGQKALNNFINAGLKIDGIVGTYTKQAMIKALQAAMNLDYEYHLVVDGILGDLSMSALETCMIKPGDIGYMVTVLEILLLLNQLDPKGIEYPGIYGKGCRYAVGLFQEKQHLEVNYIAGEYTIRKLIGVN